MENINEWEVVQVHCLNCGKTIMGYQNKYGVTKMQCDRCKSVLVSRKKSPKKYFVTIERP